jgi:hypothetical protein
MDSTIASSLDSLAVRVSLSSIESIVLAIAAGDRAAPVVIAIHPLTAH